MSPTWSPTNDTSFHQPSRPRSPSSPPPSLPPRSSSSPPPSPLPLPSSHSVPPLPLFLSSPSPSLLSDPSRPRISTARIYAMTAADFGLSFVWVCKFALTSSYFRLSLGAGPLTSHLVWSIGPLSGMLAAPVVGVLSDACMSRFGRRRPFIFFGTVAAVVGLQLFSSASAITWHSFAIVQAVVGYAILDFATNVIMFPSRALLGDLVATNQQHDVQSAAAVIASVAEICAGAYVYSWDAPVTHITRILGVASLILLVTVSITIFMCVETPLEDIEDVDVELASVDSDASAHGDIELLTAIDGVGEERSKGGAAPIFSLEDFGARDGAAEVGADWHVRAQHGREVVNDCSPASRSASGELNFESRPLGMIRRLRSRPQHLSWYEALQDVALKAKRAIIEFPPELWKVSIPLFLAWGCWFATLPSYSVWIGESVLGGSATGTVEERSLYQAGVNVFAVATLSKSILSLLFSLAYPFLVRSFGHLQNNNSSTRRGEKIVYGAPFIVFAVILFANAYTKSRVTATIVIAAGAIPFIATLTIPSAITIISFPENLASNLGVLNLVVVSAQLLDTLYTGILASKVSEAAVLQVGAFWALAAGVAAFKCF